MFDSKIDDITHYNDEMRKSLIDKAFFLDKVDADIFVDFGCADGSLIQFIETMFPSVICIGYDISQAELDIAATKTDAPLYSEWDLLVSHLDSIRENKRVAVVCNSLIHEVYAYGTEDSIDTFWGQIFGDTFDTVIIRDMCTSKSAIRQSDPIAVAKVRQRYDRTRLAEFEAQWGNIESNWSLTHFLLKYRYETNWQREVMENYLPLNFEDLLALIPNDYDPTYVDHFTLPFIRQKANEELGVDITDRTHIKLILEKK